MSRHPRVTEQILGPPDYDAVDAVAAAPKASKLYEMWHKKKPDGAHALSYTFPESVGCIGIARSILYHSDKWEEDGNGYDYEHDFESGPKVYAPSDSPYFVRGNPVTDTSKIIRADINGDVPMPMLAVVREFVYEDLHGAKKEMVFTTHMPLLCMTHDAKGLVIFTSMHGTETPLFVRGGEMRVTGHGIIK